MRERVLDLTDFDAAVDFECPRCRTATTERFFGPCSACSASLRDEMIGDADRASAPADYEPKMNVTPNAVAQRDG